MGKTGKFRVFVLRAECGHGHAADSGGHEEYVERHGNHFTGALADDVCARMVNADGSKHRWTAGEVAAAVGELPDGVTVGDMTYLANMAYADFFPKVLASEAACIGYAKAVVNDPDGYDGLPFHRWLADVVAKGERVEWERYV